jgi:lysylphosphatidylglycerol synthetase-like protein (DUF2156 family)
MATEKSEFLLGLFNQIESQVQFGDHKASLLVAGDALLLTITGGLINMVSGCPQDTFSVQCAQPSAPLLVSLLTALLLVISLVCALLATRPSSIHDDPPPDIFLFSHVALLKPGEFVDAYKAASGASLEEAALLAIHSKAKYATRKFRRLKYAVTATLLGVGSLVATLVVTVSPALAR